MHELSVASAILETVRRHADERPVKLVSVRVGHLRQVVPDSLRFYWDIVRAGTVCDQARLELEEIEVGLRCTACAHEWEPLIPAFRCPECHSGKVAVRCGRELEVDYIEVEDRPAATARPQEAACIARR